MVATFQPAARLGREATQAIYQQMVDAGEAR